MVMVLAQGPALGVRRRGEEASETFYYQFCSEQAVRFEIHFSSSLHLLHVIISKPCSSTSNQVVVVVEDCNSTCRVGSCVCVGNILSRVYTPSRGSTTTTTEYYDPHH